MSIVRVLTPTSYSRSINRLYPFAFEAAALPPTLLGQIPNLSAAFDSGTHQFDLSDYFAGADTYAVDPAVEAGWSFDTNTGILTIDTDVEDTFGPYTLTATNGNGDTDSNGFSIYVVTARGGRRKMRFGFGHGF